MPLYTSLASLSQTAASNAADGSVDAPSTIDQQTNLLASFIAQLRDGIGFTGQLGYKNRVMNGNFSINQRAVSGTVTLAAGIYGHDRWKAGASGCTYTFSTSGQDTTINISAGSLQQVVEGANIEGGTYVLSWTGTAQGKIAAGSYSATGVTGSGTPGSNLTIEFNTGTLTKVQLETGSSVSAFERRPVGYELVLCKRYFQLFVVGFVGATTSGTAYGGCMTLPVEMRVIPTTTAIGDQSNTNFGALGTLSHTPIYPYAVNFQRNATATALSGYTTQMSAYAEL